MNGWTSCEGVWVRKGCPVVVGEKRHKIANSQRQSIDYNFENEMYG